MAGSEPAQRPGLEEPGASRTNERSARSRFRGRSPCFPSRPCVSSGARVRAQVRRAPRPTGRRDEWPRLLGACSRSYRPPSRFPPQPTRRPPSLPRPGVSPSP
ncbi:hypothetical protein AKJ08_3220 [Vulgatibacter incomptus]|uniref:Uncharacterized protein n=1 Tax=Vulgatibacter incomptus TaxID=1391653 RepID=A0A0K1PH20_9BACT|nr:hypothetical protein AKJ08_3220 [Vulgatibacter incomptus]